MTPWKQVTIVGVGLIGGSLGLALRQRGLARRIVGVGHRLESLDQARSGGVIDEATLDPAAGVRGSDLVVLATPVGLLAKMMEHAAGTMEPGTTVIDVGSTKAEVVSALESLAPAGCAVVGCHPIAGSERRGVGAARPDLFAGAVCVLTPTARTPTEALNRVADMWRALGMTVRLLSPAEHDRLLAEVSHLPHVVASALVQAASAEAEPLIGPGWSDTTRIAAGDAALWRDILMSNRKHVVAAIERFQRATEAIRAALDRGDAHAIQTLLAESQARRQRLSASRNQATCGNRPETRGPA